MKKDKKMIISFLAPALIIFSVVYIYPIIRTILMSFFKVSKASSPISEWSFNGITNYINAFNSPVFIRALQNVVLIWLVGGIVTLSLSLLFAVLLTSGIRGKSFFRAVIYLPNVISAVALATMWTNYVFDQRFGFINTLFNTNIRWLNGDLKFWSMLIAFCFGAIGYYMLIFMSGIEKIPQDLFEAAKIDGASATKQFSTITLPLLRSTFKMNITFWSISVAGFFVWSKMFSPITTENSTVVPIVYIYDTVFGSKAASATDAGVGTAVGCIVSLIIMTIFFITNKLIKDDDLEF